jgi:multifunctional methyltransferase subunit TRM112
VVVYYYDHTDPNHDENRTEKGYPLKIEATEIVTEETPVDATFCVKMLSKLNYDALLGAVRELKEGGADLPDLPLDASDIIETKEEEETIMAQFHRVLFDIHVMEGHLVCPDTGRRFPIKGGIPNMILHEDEI